MMFMIAIFIILKYTVGSCILDNKSPKANAPDILIRISSVFNIIINDLLAKLTIWAHTQLLVYSYIRNREFDTGIIYSINKLMDVYCISLQH
jgi:hypothetical protein